MCQAVLSPNLTKKFQWEVSQIAHNRFPCVTLLGGLSVNLNHLKMKLDPMSAPQIIFQIVGYKIFNLQGSRTSALAPHDICLKEVS